MYSQLINQSINQPINQLAAKCKPSVWFKKFPMILWAVVIIEWTTQFISLICIGRFL